MGCGAFVEMVGSLGVVAGEFEGNLGWVGSWEDSTRVFAFSDLEVRGWL